MTIHLLPIALLLLFGTLSVVLTRLPRVSHLLGSGGAALAGLVGLGTTVGGLAAGSPAAFSVPWNSAVGGSFSIGFDVLSGVFLLAIYLLGTLCAAAALPSLLLMVSNLGPAQSVLLWFVLYGSLILLIGPSLKNDREAAFTS